MVAISQFYGNNPDFVLAGGGNTSWKDKHTLYVKGSGMALAQVCADSFVKMDRTVLSLIWEKQYPDSSAERESAVFADIMKALKNGEEGKRPSVETLLHDILPFDFVVHLHPALVNGLTCSQQGESAMKCIFGNEALWIPSCNPGYILSKTVKTAMDACITAHGKLPQIFFLQNHGVFVGDSSIEGIQKIYSTIMEKIGARIQRHPDFSDEKRTASLETAVTQTLRELAGGTAVLLQAAEISKLVINRDSFAPVSSVFSPDHMVHAGIAPLFIEALTKIKIRAAWDSHVQRTGMNPRIIAVKGLGVYGASATEKSAGYALDLFRDVVKISVYSASFGGPLFMTQEKIDFIKNWEVDRYRSQ